MTTVYVVTADTYHGGYGAEIELFGVYTDEETAKKRCEDIQKMEYFAKIEKGQIK